MKGIKKEQVIDYFVNPPPGKIKMLKEHRDLQTIDDSTSIKYWRFKFPLINDRDVIFKLQIKKAEGEGNLVFANSIPWDDIPVPKHVVRMAMLDYVYVRPDPEDANSIIYTEIVHFDMKGNMPPRLLNMSIASESMKEYTAMFNYLKPKK